MKCTIPLQTVLQTMSRFCILVNVCAIFVFSQLCRGETLYISPSGTDSATCGTSIANACATINQSVRNGAGAIDFVSGEYYWAELVNITASQLTFISSGVATINCQSNPGWILSIDDLHISNLAFVNCVAGSGGQGGALNVNSVNATITNVTFVNNTAPIGSALSLTSTGASLVSNCHFTANVANGWGLLSASGQGGALSINAINTNPNVAAVASVLNCTFTENAADFTAANNPSLSLERDTHICGAAVCLTFSGQGASSALLQDVSFENNTLSAVGMRSSGNLIIGGGAAAIFCKDIDTINITIDGCQFSNNKVQASDSAVSASFSNIGGGAVLIRTDDVDKTQVSVNGGTFRNNNVNATSASGSDATHYHGGGAIYIISDSQQESVTLDVRIHDVEFFANGVFLDNTIALGTSTTGNFMGGGAVMIQAASFPSDANVSVNIDAVVASQNFVWASDCVADGNGNTIGGGGIAVQIYSASSNSFRFARSEITTVNSTFWNNSVAAENCIALTGGSQTGGGAIYAFVGSNSTASLFNNFTNCTFVGNSVNVQGTRTCTGDYTGGGAVYSFAAIHPPSSTAYVRFSSNSTVFLQNSVQVYDSKTLSSCSFPSSASFNGGGAVYTFGYAGPQIAVPSIALVDVHTELLHSQVVDCDCDIHDNIGRNGLYIGGGGTYTMAFAETLPVSVHELMQFTTFNRNALMASEAVTNGSSFTGGGATYSLGFSASSVAISSGLSNCSYEANYVEARHIQPLQLNFNGGGAAYVHSSVFNFSPVRINLSIMSCNATMNNVNSYGNVNSQDVIGGGFLYVLEPTSSMVLATPQTRSDMSRLQMYVFHSQFIRNSVSTPLRIRDELAPKCNGGAISAMSQGNEFGPSELFVMIVNCVFERNTAANAGGALSFSTQTVQVLQSRFVDNSAMSGGAVNLGPQSSETFIDCKFTGNYAYISGGALVSQNILTVINCYFAANFANAFSAELRGFGGAIMSFGTLNVSDTIVTGCDAVSGGAMFMVGTFYGQPSTLTNVTMLENRAYYGGGAITTGNDVQLWLTDCSFHDNIAYQGGACFITGNSHLHAHSVDFVGNRAVGGNYGGSVALTSVAHGKIFSSRFSRSYATSGGGAFSVSDMADLRVEDTYVVDSSSRSGGVFSCAGKGTIVLDNVIASYTSVFSSGSVGVIWDYCVISINNSLFENTVSPGEGAIFISSASALAMNNVTIRYSEAVFGAAICVEDSATVVLSGCTLMFNFARENGGAVMLSGDAQVAIIASLLSHNRAESSGGALCVLDGQLLLQNVQVFNNSASRGGGMFATSNAVQHYSCGAGFDQAVFDSNNAFNHLSLADIMYGQGGGGAIFWDLQLSETRSLASHCVTHILPTLVARFNNNTANFGADYTSTPVSMLSNTSVVVRPGDNAIAELYLLDIVGQPVQSFTGQMFQVNTTNLEVRNSIVASNNGAVRISADVYVNAPAVGTFIVESKQLNLTATDVMVTVAPCLEGTWYNPDEGDCSICPISSFSVSGKCLPCNISCNSDMSCIETSHFSCPGGQYLVIEDYYFMSPEVLATGNLSSLVADRCPLSTCSRSNVYPVAQNGPQLYPCRAGSLRNGSSLVCSACNEGTSSWSNQCVPCETWSGAGVAMLILEPLVVALAFYLLAALSVVTADSAMALGQMASFMFDGTTSSAVTLTGFFRLFPMLLYSGNCPWRSSPSSEFALRFVFGLLALVYCLLIGIVQCIVLKLRHCKAVGCVCAGSATPCAEPWKTTVPHIKRAVLITFLAWFVSVFQFWLAFWVACKTYGPEQQAINPLELVFTCQTGAQALPIILVLLVGLSTTYFVVAFVRFARIPSETGAKGKKRLVLMYYNNMLHHTTGLRLVAVVIYVVCVTVSTTQTAMIALCILFAFRLLFTVIVANQLPYKAMSQARCSMAAELSRTKWFNAIDGVVWLALTVGAGASAAQSYLTTIIVVAFGMGFVIIIQVGHLLFEEVRQRRRSSASTVSLPVSESSVNADTPSTHTKFVKVGRMFSEPALWKALGTELVWPWTAFAAGCGSDHRGVSEKTPLLSSNEHQHETARPPSPARICRAADKLIKAAFTNDSDTVRKLLKKYQKRYPDVDMIHHHGTTDAPAFWWAMAHGAVDACRVLLMAGAIYPNSCHISGITPLQAAIAFDRYNVISFAYEADEHEPTRDEVLALMQKGASVKNPRRSSICRELLERVAIERQTSTLQPRSFDEEAFAAEYGYNEPLVAGPADAYDEDDTSSYDEDEQDYDEDSTDAEAHSQEQRKWLGQQPAGPAYE